MAAETVPAPPPADFATLAAAPAEEKTPADVAGARDGSTARSVPSGHGGGALDVRERERRDRGGRNDEIRSAERLARFGTDARFQDVHIRGTLADVDGAETTIGPFPEDDGAIPLAAPLGLSAARPAVRAAAAIGDGPHGSRPVTARGDFDFYAVRDAAAGQVLTVDLDAAAIGSGLDAAVAVTDATGAILAFNDDSPELDSFLQLTLPADGTYFVAVAAFGSLPTNPFDSASGTGARTEGPYELMVSYRFAQDVDVYRVDLRPGDVLGASVTGAARVLEVLDRTGTRVMGSGRDQTANYPDDSPLVMPGNATLDHVAALPGRHFVVVSRGEGDYRLDLRVRRPALETAAPGERQILFLDFDGAFVDPTTFGSDSGDLSPLAEFLPGWGLGQQDESALIDAVRATVVENLQRDPAERGGNPGFDVEIRNSRDHLDPWGEPNVTRIIIGGSREQLGFDTVGLAQTVDAGNFDREETAVVLLDQLSAPAGSGLSDDQRLRLPGRRYGRPRGTDRGIHRLARGGTPARQPSHGTEQRRHERDGHARRRSARPRTRLRLRHRRRRRRRLRHRPADRRLRRCRGHAHPGGVRPLHPASRQLLIRADGRPRTRIAQTASPAGRSLLTMRVRDS